MLCRPQFGRHRETDSPGCGDDEVSACTRVWFLSLCLDSRCTIAQKSFSWRICFPEGSSRGNSVCQPCCSRHLRIGSACFG
jgi:hypothetical protein